MNIEKKINQKLVMTLLARNEEDIIEDCIKFHLNHGVDFIIATDNGSIDNTRNIFLKYQELGVLHLIDEPQHNYDQAKWVHNMILLAKKKYKADWVINVDADEFWYCHYGNLKLALPDPKKSNVLFVGAIQVGATGDEDFAFKIPKTVSGIASGIFKCLHTTKFYRHNVMGNHDVKMIPLFRKASTTLDITIFHFHIRSYKHYERKVINGVKALENNPSLRAGGHIKAAYELYKQGKLKEYYDAELRGSADDPHYIKNDSRLYDYVHNGYKSIESISFNNYQIYNGKKIGYDILDSLKRIPLRIQKKISRIKSKNS
ncbi:MAG: glycosyltransferase family 2 protein [Pseudomonadota bacterium]